MRYRITHLGIWMWVRGAAMKRAGLTFAPAAFLGTPVAAVRFLNLRALLLGATGWAKFARPESFARHKSGHGNSEPEKASSRSPE
jgi:hypothetical protein